MKRLKKIRGQRRYYRNLLIQNDFDQMPWFSVTKQEDWFDFWHIHMDWKGFGNSNFKKRKPHLDKLFRHFVLLSERLIHCPIPYQTFIIVFDQESASDALYLHTVHPNKDNFPYKIHDLQIASTLSNTKLQAYIDGLTQFEKLYGQAEEAYCLLYQKEFGHPFTHP